jgi:hypothetical protein
MVTMARDNSNPTSKIMGNAELLAFECLLGHLGVDYFYHYIGTLTFS